LYWTDILMGRLFWYNPLTSESRQCYDGRMVGGFTVQSDGSLLLFMDKGAVVVWRDGQIIRTVIDSIPTEFDQRFNDVAADPVGRVLCGTIPLSNVERRSGKLYQLDLDGTYRVLLDKIGISNGIAFSTDCKTMYYVDSLADTIWKFAYEQETGEISNQEEFLTFASESGSPDGMTVDRNGNLWIAVAMGWGIVQYDPDGKLLRRIELPAKFVSSLAFGGENLTQLFVTTGTDCEGEDRGEAAGSLMVVEPGVAGVSEFCSRILI